MSDNGSIELLPVAVTKHIQHTWLEVEDRLKQASHIMFKRYIAMYVWLLYNTICMHLCSITHWLHIVR